MENLEAKLEELIENLRQIRIICCDFQMQGPLNQKM
jgi:hypothetical protein